MNDLITVPAQPGELDIMTLGKLLVESRYFQDAGQMAQAVVKVLAGRELGFGPIASMTGIHIVQGRPTLGADLLAKAVKRSGRYNYRVVELSDTRCELAFFERDGDKWAPIGTSPFTVDDAKRAGTKNLDKYPRNMLFARAMSNGVKWFCPDAIGLTVYDPSELPQDDGPALTLVDTATGEITQAQPVITDTQPVIAQAEPMNGESPTYNLANPKRVTYLRIMCETMYKGKADEIRAGLCEWASRGATSHSAELAEDEAEMVIKELETRMLKRGYTRDNQGHWSKEPTIPLKQSNVHATLESSIAHLTPAPTIGAQATAELFGDAS